MDRHASCLCYVQRDATAMIDIQPLVACYPYAGLPNIKCAIVELFVK